MNNFGRSCTGQTVHSMSPSWHLTDTAVLTLYHDYVLYSALLCSDRNGDCNGTLSGLFSFVFIRLSHPTCVHDLTPKCAPVIE
jgi:hypothetical protein